MTLFIDHSSASYVPVQCPERPPAFVFVDELARLYFQLPCAVEVLFAPAATTGLSMGAAYLYKI